jgi:molecular chaperone DnaJ
MEPELTQTIFSKSGQQMDNDPDSHKNEGFLKSMWHNLTNHPAHQKQDGQSDAGSSAKDSSAEKKNDDKKDEDPKKPSSG